MNLRLLSLLSFLLLCACTKNNQSAKIFNQTRKDSAYFYFEEGKDSREVRQKITFFNKALQHSEDPYDSLTPVILDYKIYYHNDIKEFDTALYVANRLIDVAETQNDSGFLAQAFYRKSVISRYINQHEKTFDNAYKARQIYLKMGDTASAGRRTSEMAFAQSQLTDYTGAQQSATEALSFLPETDSSYISSAHNTIATSYRNQDLYEDAVFEWRNALKYATSIQDSLSNLNNIALALQDNGKYQEAIEILENILERSDEIRLSSKARFLDNLAYTKWLQDSSANVTQGLIKAMEIRLRENDHNGLLASYDHLSDYYWGKNKRLSETYADSLLKTAEKIGSSSAQLNALQKLIQLSPPVKTKALSNTYIKLNDSIRRENIRTKNFFAKIRYDEEQKQQEIDHLEAETIRQKLQTQELRNQTLILSLGASLILLSGGFGFYYFRQKHKRDKLREVYKTEARISKKIHDELANDVYNVMSEMEPIAPAHMIDKLEHIYSRTRNISRENSRIPVNETFLPHLVSTLGAIIPENTRLILRGESSIDWQILSAEKKIVIYRVLQEIMINMKKHSRANLVAISFSRKGKQLEISYSDNGIASSLETIKSGNGIRNTENRIFSIGGRLNFETEQNKGMKILILIPI